jgi:hypothetical protein
MRRTSAAAADPAAEPEVATGDEQLCANEFMTKREYLPPAYARALHATLAPYEHVAGTFYPTASRSVGSDGRARGYVFRVLGSTAVDARETPFVHSKTGAGVSWYGLEAFDDKALNKRIAAAHKSGSAAAAAPPLPPGMSVFTALSHRTWDTRHFLIVHGVDRAASTALLDRVEAAVRAGAPLSVADVVASAEYARVLKDSAAARRRVADAYVAAHSLTYAAAARGDTGTHTTHALETADDASLALGAPVVDVYDDATNPARAHDGVLVYKGPIGGFTLRRGPTKATGAGASSRHFTTPVAAEHLGGATGTSLNVVATTSGHYYGDAPPAAAASGDLVRRVPALSAATSAAHAAEHERRVHYSGALVGYNPRAHQRYNADDDDHARETRTRLGLAAPASGGAGDDELEEFALTTLSAELPSLDPLDMSFEQLAAAAAVTSARTIAVPESGLVVKSLVRNWAAISGALRLTSYASALAAHHDGVVDVSTDIVRAVARIELKAAK